MTDRVDAIRTEFEPSRAGFEAPGGKPAAPTSDSQASAETDSGPAGAERIEETVEGVPVLAEAQPLVSGPSSMLPAVQAAAAAATGFVAGAATLALVRRHGARKLARSRPAPRRPTDMLPVVGSRTFIVDVHLLARPGE